MSSKLNQDDMAKRAQQAMTNTPKYIYRSMPIEDDPRFKKMMKEYKERCDLARNLNCLAVSAVLSTITSPLRVISMSM